MLFLTTPSSPFPYIVFPKIIPIVISSYRFLHTPGYWVTTGPTSLLKPIHPIIIFISLHFLGQRTTHIFKFKLQSSGNTHYKIICPPPILVDINKILSCSDEQIKGANRCIFFRYTPLRSHLYSLCCSPYHFSLHCELHKETVF